MVQTKRLVGVVFLLIIVILITTWGIRLAQNQAISNPLIPFTNTCVFFQEDFNSDRVPIEPTCSYIVVGKVDDVLDGFPENKIVYSEVILGTSLPVSEQRFGGWEVAGDRVRCLITQVNDFQDNPIDEFIQLISGLQTLPLKDLQADQIVNCFDFIRFNADEWEFEELDFVVLFDSLEGSIDPENRKVITFRFKG